MQFLSNSIFSSFRHVWFHPFLVPPLLFRGTGTVPLRLLRRAPDVFRGPGLQSHVRHRSKGLLLKGVQLNVRKGIRIGQINSQR